MKYRAVLLLGALLASPAWSQETPSFDLKSDAVRNIVRTTAATQFATKLVEEKTPDPAEKTVHFVPPEKQPAKERSAPRPMPAPRDGFVSDLVTSLIEHELDKSLDHRGPTWESCESGVPAAQARVVALCEP